MTDTNKLYKFVSDIELKPKTHKQIVVSENLSTHLIALNTNFFLNSNAQLFLPTVGQDCYSC